MYYIIFIILLISNGLFSENFRDYKFNWYPKINVGDDHINFPDSSKYEIYNTSGVWEDNLGNYGMMKCIVSQFTDKNSKIALDGYCKAQDSLNESFWLYLNRKSFNLAGVGNAKYLFTQKKYKVLLNKTCPYAAQVFEGGGVFKLVCKISNENYNKLVRKR